MNNKDRNVLALAYLGDSVYEIHIRNFLISKGLEKVKLLQEEAVKYVSAKSQAAFLTKMIEDNFLTEQEIGIVKCARNHKNNHKPKNCDVATYNWATGFEALIGYLYLENKQDRIKEIMKEIIGE